MRITHTSASRLMVFSMLASMGLAASASALRAMPAAMQDGRGQEDAHAIDSNEPPMLSSSCLACP